jgi:predicted acetyltransferase
LRTLTPPRTELSTRTVTEADHPRIREIYAARARRSSGWFDRSQAYWAQRVFAVYRAKLMGCVFESQGEIEAYVLYWHREQPGPVHYDLSVRDHGATTPRGLAAIVSFLTSHRSIAEHATLYSSGVDPLLFALEEQDTRAVIQHFAWMLRLVDVPAALALRGYPAPINATLHLDVHDELLAGNHGRFVLRVRDGVGSVEPGGEGSLRTDVRGLAALFTGYATASELALAGRLTCDDGTARTADALFAGPAPGMPDMF